MVPVAHGIAHCDAYEEGIIGDDIGPRLYEKEDGDDKGCAQDDGAQCDIAEVLQTRIEPLDPEEVGRKFQDGNGNQQTIVLQTGRHQYHTTEHDGDEQCGAEVQRKEVGERLTQGLGVVLVLRNLPHTHRRQSHHRKEDTIVDHVIDGIHDANALHTQHTADIGKDDQRYEVGAHGEHCTIGQIALDVSQDSPPFLFPPATHRAEPLSAPLWPRGGTGRTQTIPWPSDHSNRTGWCRYRYCVSLWPASSRNR